MSSVFRRRRTPADAENQRLRRSRLFCGADNVVHLIGRRPMNESWKTAASTSASSSFVCARLFFRYSFRIGNEDKLRERSRGKEGRAPRRGGPQSKKTKEKRKGPKFKAPLPSLIDSLESFPSIWPLSRVRHGLSRGRRVRFRCFWFPTAPISNFRIASFLFRSDFFLFAPLASTTCPIKRPPGKLPPPCCCGRMRSHLGLAKGTGSLDFDRAINLK